MSYILQNGASYCFINNRNAVLTTQNIDLATKFADSEKAFEQLHRATKKLKGFCVVDIKTNEKVNEVKKVKRKQFSKTDRNMIYNKNRGRCAICGNFVPFDSFTVDHIVPLAKGGTNELKNPQCTCKTCNLIKHDILPEDLMDKLNQIVIYQMRVKFDDRLYSRIVCLKRKQQKQKISRVLKILSRGRK